MALFCKSILKPCKTIHRHEVVFELTFHPFWMDFGFDLKLQDAGDLEGTHELLGVLLALGLKMAFRRLQDLLQDR
eukprot:3334469-Karenia_brevis.AAC.1